MEEFKQNWSYIRHMEQIRLVHTRILLIITGALLTVFAVLIKLPSGMTITLDGLKYPMGIASLFIFVYGWVLGIFLAHQKRGYEHYRIVNAQVRKWLTEKCGEPGDMSKFRFEKELPSERTVGQVLSSTFFYWYLLIVFINLAALGSFLIIIFGFKILLWPLVLVVLVALLLQCGHFVQINMKIVTTPG